MIIKYLLMAIVGILVFSGCVDKKYVKIDSAYINKSNNQTLLSEYKGKCSAGIQNKNLNLKLVFNNRISPPSGVQVSPTFTSVELLKVPYQGDFDKDVDLGIKSILNDVCNATFDNNSKSSELLLSFHKFQSNESNLTVIENYFIPFIGKSRTYYKVNTPYFFDVDVKSNSMNIASNYNREYKLTSYSDLNLNTSLFTNSLDEKYELESIPTKIKIFNADINSSHVVFGDDATINYSFKTDNNTIIGKNLAVQAGLWQSIVISDIDEYNILRMLTDNNRIISPNDKAEYLEDIHAEHSKPISENNDKNNLGGIYSFMIYDLAEFIIQNAK
jgi:hypothetical protein